MDDELYKEASENTKLLESYFIRESGFSLNETLNAMDWASILLLLMWKKRLPINDKRFPEVLRALANLLELRFCKKDK